MYKLCQMKNNLDIEKDHEIQIFTALVEVGFLFEKLMLCWGGGKEAKSMEVTLQQILIVLLLEPSI